MLMIAKSRRSRFPPVFLGGTSQDWRGGRQSTSKGGFVGSAAPATSPPRNHTTTGCGGRPLSAEAAAGPHAARFPFFPPQARSRRRKRCPRTSCRGCGSAGNKGNRETPFRRVRMLTVRRLANARLEEVPANDGGQGLT